MKKRRILLIHRVTRGLGNRIRIQQIIHFLRASGFIVYEGILPSFTRSYIQKEGFSNIIGSLFPLRKFKTFDMKNIVLQRLQLTTAWNYLRRIRQQIKVDLVIAEHYLLGWLALKVFESDSIPIILDAHGLAGAEARGSKQRLWYIKEAIEVDVFRRCNHLLVVSKSMKRHIATHYRIADEKISVIYNGANLPTVRARYEFPLKVIYAGAFTYWERIDDFLDLAKIADSSTYKFYLAGGGPLKKHILARIKHERIPIKYLGFVTRPKIFDVMAQMQVGIAPSTRDTTRLVSFPIKILDYMSVGLPVITLNIGDWGQLVDVEESGIALREDSTENYIAALEALASEPIWQTKSNNGVQLIAEKYQWKNVLAPLPDLITEIC